MLDLSLIHAAGPHQDKPWSTFFSLPLHWKSSFACLQGSWEKVLATWKSPTRKVAPEISLRGGIRPIESIPLSCASASQAALSTPYLIRSFRSSLYRVGRAWCALSQSVRWNLFWSLCRSPISCPARCPKLCRKIRATWCRVCQDTALAREWSIYGRSSYLASYRRAVVYG